MLCPACVRAPRQPSLSLRKRASSPQIGEAPCAQFNFGDCVVNQGLMFRSFLSVQRIARHPARILRRVPFQPPIPLPLPHEAPDKIWGFVFVGKVAQPLELTYIYGRSARLVSKENRMQGQVVDVHTFYYSPAFMLVSFLIVFIPAINILRRTGHSPLWCLLAIVPVINVIAWWYFAFKSWPTDRKPG